MAAGAQLFHYSGSGKQGITKRVNEQGITTSFFPSSHQNEKNASAFVQIPQYIPYQTSYDSHKSFQKNTFLLRKKKICAKKHPVS